MLFHLLYLHDIVFDSIILVHLKGWHFVLRQTVCDVTVVYPLNRLRIGGTEVITLLIHLYHVHTVLALPHLPDIHLLLRAEHFWRRVHIFFFHFIRPLVFLIRLPVHVLDPLDEPGFQIVRHLSVFTLDVSPVLCWILLFFRSTLFLRLNDFICHHRYIVFICFNCLRFLHHWQHILRHSGTLDSTILVSHCKRFIRIVRHCKLLFDLHHLWLILVLQMFRFVEKLVLV